MNKKKILILLILGGAIWYFKSQLEKSYTQIRPYPYTFIEPLSGGNIKWDETQILILGDQMADSLGPYQDQIIEQASQSLASPLKIFNWGRKEEGLHRSLQKLKDLPSLPQIVIYFGGTQEFNEKIFKLEDYSKILKNFEVYDDEKKLSYMMLYPPLSKFLYQQDVITPLKALVQERLDQEQSASDFQKLQEIHFKIFKMEFEEFIQYVSAEQKYLIIITPPIDYQSPPRKSCLTPLSERDEEKLVLMNEMISKGAYKDAILELESLYKSHPTNALLNHTLGLAHFLNGDQFQAMTFFKKASVYDCFFWRGNAVMSSIIDEVSKDYGVTVIDFAQMINQDMGQNELFIHGLLPQAIYYERLIPALASQIRRLLKIGQQTQRPKNF